MGRDERPKMRVDLAGEWPPPFCEGAYLSGLRTGCRTIFGVARPPDGQDHPPHCTGNQMRGGKCFTPNSLQPRQSSEPSLWTTDRLNACVQGQLTVLVCIPMRCSEGIHKRAAEDRVANASGRAPQARLSPTSWQMSQRKFTIWGPVRLGQSLVFRIGEGEDMDARRTDILHTPQT